MKCVMSSQPTPVKSSMGAISLASPTKPAINIKMPQVTAPAFTCKQGQLVRATNRVSQRTSQAEGLWGKGLQETEQK